MEQYTLILIIVIVVLIVWLVASSKREPLLAPWDLEKCREECYRKGEQIPWFGGPQGPWDDPAASPASTFDVAGCMAKCNLQLWSDAEY